MFRITIVMPDGSRGRCLGLYSDGFEAVNQIHAHFPGAVAVSALHISGSRA